MTLDAQGLASQGVVSLLEATSVSGIAPLLKDGKIHLVVQNADFESVYLVYDMDVGRAILAMPLSGRSTGPFIGLFNKNLMAPSFEVTLISEEATHASDPNHSIFRASYAEGDISNEADCDWDFILESLHIAFMQ